VREQERGRKVEEEGDRRRNPETGETELAMTIGVAEEATIVLAGDNRACSNGRNRKDECGGHKGTGAGVGIPPRQDPYAMEVDRGRNCYACGRFGHMARNCRNWGQRGRVVDNRRVEYGGGRIEEISNFENNLKEGENLELLN